MDTNKTALIVDDDAPVLESSDLLVSLAESFQSLRALGAAGAASHLKHAHIDVIVADVILTGSMTGIDVCRKAIEHHPDIAIVVITADNEVSRSDLPIAGSFCASRLVGSSCWRRWARRGTSKPALENSLPCFGSGVTERQIAGAAGAAP